MKQFILACCLLALAASLQVPQDKTQIVNDPAKNTSSKFSPASSSESSPTDPSVSKTSRARSTFGSASGHDIAQVISTDHDSDSGSSSGHDPGSRMKWSKGSEDPASSVEKEEANSMTTPIDHSTSTLSYEEESYATDIFDWDDA